MSGRPDDEVIRLVCERIDAAIKRNRRQEQIIIVVLVLLFLTGLALIVVAAVMQRWELYVPGAFLEGLVFFPIRRLVKLRDANIRLQIIPELLRLASTRQARILAVQFIEHLIKQV